MSSVDLDNSWVCPDLVSEILKTAVGSGSDIGMSTLNRSSSLSFAATESIWISGPLVNPSAHLSRLHC